MPASTSQKGTPYAWFPATARRRVMYIAMSASFAAWLIFAQLRFYRRFIFNGAPARIWGLADDVYISACFGRSLFTGQGFVWYPGAPRVEGISNPLWSAVIGAMHWLPGFTEERLGAFVIALNALLLAIAACLFWSALARGSVGARSLAPWWTLPLLPLAAALSYWSAEGFEVALLAVCAFAMLHSALGADRTGTPLVLAAWLAAGIATRMDFVLLAAPALIIYRSRTSWRRTLIIACSAGLIVAALEIARRAYFGAWLPNTYWLKATGWPLRARLVRGWHQNAALLMTAPIPCLIFLIPRLRRHVLCQVPHALAAWAGFGLTVLYSTYVGGDSWGLFAGYDRHTAVGAVLWIWGMAAVVTSSRRALHACAASVLATLVGAWPMVWDNLARAQEGLWSSHVPVRRLEQEWIAYGKAFREISHPGARIAICPAGAIVYFSHRGGVDLLGKVDPYVANLQVATRKTKNNSCFRDAPGHNKQDDQGTFRLRQPEFSRGRPPNEQAERYQKIKYKGKLFFVLKGTAYWQAPRD